MSDSRNLDASDPRNEGEDPGAFKKRMAKAEELRRALRSTLHTEDGRKVMDFLRERFRDQACYQPGVSTAIDAVFRDGQRSVVQEIERLLRD